MCTAEAALVSHSVYATVLTEFTSFTNTYN